MLPKKELEIVRQRELVLVAKQDRIIKWRFTILVIQVISLLLMFSEMAGNTLTAINAVLFYIYNLLGAAKTRHYENQQQLREVQRRKSYQIAKAG